MNYLSKFHTSLCVSGIRLRAAMDTILDLLFPKGALIREIEQMSAASFASERIFRGHYPPECVGWARAILSYRDRRVRAAVWELKYRKNEKVAKIFAELLAGELKKISGWLIVAPIPLSEKRRRERGYNQIEMILDQLPKNDRWIIAPNLLRRKHHTVPQTKLSREERLKNLEGCFEVSDTHQSAQMLRSKCFVIIDDVMTTGSTLQQTRETILRAGAGEVIAITLAH